MNYYRWGLVGLGLGLIGMAVSAGNLIENPRFQKQLAPWILSTMADEVFEVKHDPKSGMIDLASTGPDYSGYLVQTVQVKADTHYILKVNLRHLKGRGLIWVMGYDADRKPVLFDQRKYLVSSVGNPLVPNFVPKELLEGSGNSDWRIEQLRFFTGGLPKNSKPVAWVRISLGIYFSVGRLQFSQVELMEEQHK